MAKSTSLIFTITLMELPIKIGIYNVAATDKIANKNDKNTKNLYLDINFNIFLVVEFFFILIPPF